MALILRRASASSRSSGEWQHDDYDVVTDGEVVGRIMYAGKSSPSGRPWFWGLAYGQYKDRIPAHGYEPTRAEGIAKSWRREES
jgi:hypothetical protein